MVPRTFTLAARDRELDMVLNGDRGFLGTDGCPADVIDLDTKKRRRGTKQDLADLTKIADALPEVSFMWQEVSANDIPVPVRPMHETHAQLISTSKHIQQMTAIDGFNAKGIVEMVTTVAGGATRCASTRSCRTSNARSRRGTGTGPRSTRCGSSPRPGSRSVCAPCRAQRRARP
jgi:trimethylamine:corrinoid methyltransferase-like protein